MDSNHQASRATPDLQSGGLTVPPTSHDLFGRQSKSLPRQYLLRGEPTLSSRFLVPQVGLEPTRITPLVSKTSVAAITPPGLVQLISMERDRRIELLTNSLED
jgi:hypothetical protein